MKACRTVKVAHYPGRSAQLQGPLKRDTEKESRERDSKKERKREAEGEAEKEMRGGKRRMCFNGILKANFKDLKGLLKTF
jgi:hypothetical protein